MLPGQPLGNRRHLSGLTGTSYWGAQPAMSLRDLCRRPNQGSRRRWWRARASTSGEAASCRHLRCCKRGPTRSWSEERRFSGCRWATEKRRCLWTASSRTRGRSQCNRRRRRSEVGRLIHHCRLRTTALRGVLIVVYD